MSNPVDQQLHFAVYKPFGMLSQLVSNDTKELKNKKFLGELYDFPHGTMPVGRLDERSEGLLLMTTDGKLSDLINRSGIEKEYYAQVDGDITEEALERLQHGVTIGIAGDKYLTLPCCVQKLVEAPTLPKADHKLRIGRHREPSWISITVREGKFRQVRKMTAAVGFPTLRLVRVRIGTLRLEPMAEGEVCPISGADMAIVVS